MTKKDYNFTFEFIIEMILSAYIMNGHVTDEIKSIKTTR